MHTHKGGEGSRERERIGEIKNAEIENRIPHVERESCLYYFLELCLM